MDADNEPCVSRNQDPTVPTTPINAGCPLTCDVGWAWLGRVCTLVCVVETYHPPRF